METFPNMAEPGSSSKVTIVEVAYKGGISVGAASRVINNDTCVAPKMREQVTKLMQEMGTELIIRGSTQFPKHKAGLPSEATGLAVWNSLHRKEYQHKKIIPSNPLHSIVINSIVIR